MKWTYIYMKCPLIERTNANEYNVDMPYGHQKANYAHMK